MASRKVKTGGMSILTVVFVVFFILKILGIGAVAHWSWWWVFAPLWLPTASLIGVVICFTLLAGIFGIVINIGK
jgi:hypothetical protein